MDRQSTESQENTAASAASSTSQKLLADVQGGTGSAADKPLCKSSPVYEQIIDHVIRNIYDPKAIQNPEELKSRYDCAIKSDEDAIKLAAKSIKDLDYPYTKLFSKEEVDILKTDTAGEFYGIGLQVLNSDSDFVRSKTFVGTVTTGGAAEAAGLETGDFLLSLDSKDISKLSNGEITALIRSDKPGLLTLKVNRQGQEIEFKNIERRLIETPAVKTPEVLDDEIVHLTVTTFDQDDSAEEIKKAIEKHPQAKAWIVDLRKNGGGLIDQSLRALSLFMSSGKILSEKERIDQREADDEETGPSYHISDYKLTPEKIEIDKYYEDMPGLKVLTPSRERYPDLVDKPVVVLVDGGTASASEIFAAAMQENKEATLIGTQTYGKGIGQTYSTNMPGGTWLSLTNMRLFTPKGNWLGDGEKNKIGLTPDIVVKNDEDALKVSVEHLKKVLASRTK